jgi:DNA-directed RNA polymerase subunit E'/Rpb7
MFTESESNQDKQTPPTPFTSSTPSATPPTSSTPATPAASFVQTTPTTPTTPFTPTTSPTTSPTTPITPVSSPPTEGLEIEANTAPIQGADPEIDVEKQRQIEKLKQTFADVTKKRMSKQKNIYNPVIDTIKVCLNIGEVNKNLSATIKNKVKDTIEGKCNKHGLIKNDSVVIINHSSPSIRMNIAEFYVTYQALACHPVEGMLVEASVINITKAGIRAELIGEMPSPLVIFVARDHHNTNSYFNKIKEQDNIFVKIAGVRFELNDTYVSIIGELYRT